VRLRPSAAALRCALHPSHRPARTKYVCDIHDNDGCGGGAIHCTRTTTQHDRRHEHARTRLHNGGWLRGVAAPAASSLARGLHSNAFTVSFLAH